MPGGMIMKRIIAYFLTAVMVLTAFAGCSGRTEDELAALDPTVSVNGALQGGVTADGSKDSSKDSSKDGSGYVPPLIDTANYNPGNYTFSPIMKTDKGYYYLPMNSAAYEMHYFDIASSKNIFLCNRPECLHMGDEFCTATNGNYLVNSITMYDNKIYISVYDTSDTENARLMLLRLEPDGSNLTELAELKKIVSIEYGIGIAGEMYIYRGNVITSYELYSDSKITYGTIIYNLIDGKIVTLPEYSYELSDDGIVYIKGAARGAFKGMGKYIFYNESRPKKRGANIIENIVLCRYNLETGETEDFVYNGAYKGIYTVKSEDIVIFANTYGNIFEYKWSEKKAVDYGKKTRTLVQKFKLSGEAAGDYTFPESEKGIIWNEFENEFNLMPSDIIIYDGVTYLLSGIGISGVTYLTQDVNNLNYCYYSLVALDDNYDERKTYDINVASICEQLPLNDSSYRMASASIFEDQMYIQYEDGVFVCPMADILAEKSTFTQVFLRHATDLTK